MESPEDDGNCSCVLGPELPGPEKTILSLLRPAMLHKLRSGGIQGTSGSRRCPLPSDPQNPSLFNKSVTENTVHNFFKKNCKPPIPYTYAWPLLKILSRCVF